MDEKAVIVLDINGRIKEFMDIRGWSEYRLAKEADLSQSTISNLFRRNTVPSIYTLDAICAGLGITLSQFFSENDLVELTAEQKELFDHWISLSQKQKDVLDALIKSMSANS
jgi:transcriptional regulator with XRE-family HTH domain